jgi:hypothetical protein
MGSMPLQAVLIQMRRATERKSLTIQDLGPV